MKYVVLRARESGRLWLWTDEVLSYMPNHDRGSFDEVMRGDDLEALKQMISLANHEIDQQLKLEQDHQ